MMNGIQQCFVQLVQIGSNDLAQKVTGLVRKRIGHIINCNSLKEDGTQVLDLFGSGFKYVDIRSDVDLDDEEVQGRLKDFAEKADQRHQIMIHSESISKSRVVLCKIAMRVFGLELKVILQILEEKQRSKPNQIDFDPQDYVLTPTEKGELVKFELKLFGASSLLNDLLTVQPVPTSNQSTTSLTQTSHANETISNLQMIKSTEDQSVSDELLIKIYEEDLKLEPSDNATADTSERVRSPIPARQMVLVDTLDDPPDITESFTDSSTNSFQVPSQQSLVKSLVESRQDRTEGSSKIAKNARRKEKMDMAFVNFMSTFSDSAPKVVSTDQLNSPYVPRPLPTSSTNRTNSTRVEDYRQIMSIMSGRVNPDLVRDMLESGMSVSEILDSLTL